MENGWIKWNGGDCPIKSDKTVVEVQWQTGDIDQHVTLDTGFAWERTDESIGWYITAYRIIEDNEPMTQPQTRKELTAQIEALQKQLDDMPNVKRWYWSVDGLTNDRWPIDSHYLDIDVINGVPYVHGIAMKEVDK